LRRQEERNQGRKKTGPEPWVAPQMKLFRISPPIQEDLPWDKRLEFVRAIGARAKAEFDEKFTGIEKWLTEYDPVYVLSMCALYFISYPEGTDPEVTGKLEFPHHYLEIMQAFALYQERNITARPLLDKMEVLKKEMQEIGEVMRLRHLYIPPETLTEEELHAYRLRQEMMMHTTAVRNWAYPHQLKKVVLDLAATIAPDFEALYKIDPVDFLNLLFQLIEEREELLNGHINKLRSFMLKSSYKEIIAAYNAAFPENTPITEDEDGRIWVMVGKKKDVLRDMLMSHSDLKLEKIYKFDLAHAHSLLAKNVDIEFLRQLLDKVSHKFGELADFKKEHIVLSNPVLAKPFIKITDDEYFSAVWGVLPHISLDILEHLVWPHNDLRDKYTREKAKYLEDELERIVKAGFPNATVCRGSLWKEPSTGVEYENDLIAVIDSFALIFEAKSASVTDPARRGAPERLAETLRELMEEPSEQAHRFAHHLQTISAVHEFRTKHGATNVIDSSTIKHYIPIGVTLSHLGSIGSNLKKLIEAKIVDKKLEELAPSINITDLESVLELLPLEIEKVHYFARRREFEAHMEYEGDELDLLAFYLENGFNIGQTEYAKDTMLNIGLKSKELDIYFVGSREQKNVAKPKLAMSDWWSAILARISETKIEGWIETGFILLNTTREDQEKFEQGIKQLVGNIKRGKVKKQHNWVLWESGPERRRYIIAGYPYTTGDKELRNSIIGEIIDGQSLDNARGVAVIGVDITDPGYPYNVLARRASTNLLDTLTL